MKKTIRTVALGMSLLILPGTAFAADSVSLDDVSVDATTLTMRFTEAKSGDWYQLYMNDQVQQGLLTAEDIARGYKSVNTGVLGSAKEGATVRVEMKGNAALSFIENQVIVGRPSAVEAPKMTLEGTLKPDGTAQTITVHGPEGYEPKATDTVRVVPYDVNGKVLAEVQLFQVPLNSVQNGKTVFLLPLKPGADVGSYTVELMRGSTEVLASATVVLQGEAPTTEGLRLTYPATVKLGEKVVPKLEMTDDKGATVEVTPFATYTYEGNALMKDTFAGGQFTVGSDAAFVGTEIRVTATLNGESKTATMKVVAADGTPANTEGAKEVVMTIDSKTLTVDGKKIEAEVAPFITDNRTLVPIRVLAETFGAKVDYDAKTEKITITQGNEVTVMQIGSTAYTVNGEKKTLDKAPYISYSNRTIVPVRFAAEGLGYGITVIYDGNGATERIIFKKN